MAGHGRPIGSLFPWARTARKGADRGRSLFALGALLIPALLACQTALAADQSMRIRVSWGGGSERTWQGAISINQGAMSEPQSLGIEADEPGSMWLDGNQKLVVRQRSARSYDGADLLLTAPSEAALTVKLTAADDQQHPVSFDFPLNEINSEALSKDIDKQGNRLLVHRAPGDELRVAFQRDSLVFVPGETFKFTVEPNLLPLAAGSRAQLKAVLVPARGQRELWSTQINIQGGQTAPIPLEVPLGNDEGAFDIVISVVHNASLQEAVRQPLNWKKTVAERSIQCLVLNSTGRPAAVGKNDPALTLLATIDPANPRWWDLLGKLTQLPKIPNPWKSQLSNGNAQVWKHPLGEIIRLNPNAESPDASWEAYTLPIGQPGKPHVLEVEYPSDVSQTLGISILEPNAAGALTPITLDSGVDLAPEVVAGRPPVFLKHRLVFWPRTTHPLVLMSNRRDRSPAVYGKIRLYGGWEHLPPAAPVDPRADQRLLAAYFDRPLFPENFAASEALDNWSGLSLDDWTTFHEGGTRLIEYLKYVGYNGLMLSVMADGSTIYPTTLLAPTPRYDKGMLFATGQDPVRKDVLEMLLRQFDREQLQMIPALDFSAPLPDLEAVVRRGGAEADAVQWIGPEGEALVQVERPRRGLAPYYNVLNPQVQQSMRAVVRELVRRYSRHPSFAGVALQLSSGGYAQLPGPEWGMNDEIIARFQQDTGIRVPGEGANRYAQRAEFLLTRQRAAWLQWRAESLNHFHQQLQNDIASVRSDGKLYLAGANMFAGDRWDYLLRPTLTRTTTLADALLLAGIDAQRYQSPRGPVLLKPDQIAPYSAPAAWAMNLGLSQMSDADRLFQNAAAPGSLFYHPPQESRIESFDAKSPFKPTYTLLLGQSVPSDRQNRRRFAHSLSALDCQMMVDGGFLLELGQEDSLRGILAAYRRLPGVRFQRVGEGRNDAGAQPVTFRAAVYAGRTYVYAVNDSPFTASARVRVDAPAGCKMEELTGSRQVAPLQRQSDGTTWTVELEPFDVVAVQFSEPGVQLSQAKVVLPNSVEGDLQQRIRKLGGQTAALRVPQPLKSLGNSGFERPAAGDDPIPDWLFTKRSGFSASIDKTQSHGGNQAAHVASNGTAGSLLSRQFAAPATGRLTMEVWLRLADASRQPPVRLALEGKLNGQSYYRCAEVGVSTVTGQAAVPLTANWTQFIFTVDDLPLEGLSALRVRFDLMGAGDVWIDDVQLYDLAFSEKERHELAKLITLAEYQLENRQIGDCVRLLEGYWPRFLEDNVPAQLSANPLAQKPAAPENSEAGQSQPAAQKTGLKDRVKGMLPEQLRF
jgi:hypothetical protein